MVDYNIYVTKKRWLVEENDAQFAMFTIFINLHI